MKQLLQILALFYAVCWIASAVPAVTVAPIHSENKSSTQHQSQGEIDYPQNLPAAFFHKSLGDEQVLTEHFRFNPDKSFYNQVTQARKPSLFINEFSIQILHKRAAVPLFIKGQALLC